MKILVVEDDPLVADDLVDKLNTLAYRVTAIAESYETALLAVKTEKPDLALLDIELKGELTGIDLAQVLSQMGIPFIYLTSIQDMSTYLLAKNTAPLKNLPKPVNLLSLRNAILEIDLSTQMVADIAQILLMTTKDGVKLQIDPDSITHLIAAGSYCDIHFVDGKKNTVVSSMKEVYEKLEHPNIVRIARSHCVHLKHIVAVRGNDVEMPHNVRLGITESYKSDFSRHLKQL
ncbi:response regulator transcription factor [Fluviicola taffensis]|uniref:response regulator transcription factor n=1 Tax=Fluviicola taffensis TaxID=191579 RepID=UPI0031380B02